MAGCPSHRGRRPRPGAPAGPGAGARGSPTGHRPARSGPARCPGHWYADPRGHRRPGGSPRVAPGVPAGRAGRAGDAAGTADRGSVRRAGAAGARRPGAGDAGAGGGGQGRSPAAAGQRRGAAAGGQGRGRLPTAGAGAAVHTVPSPPGAWAPRVGLPYRCWSTWTRSDRPAGWMGCPDPSSSRPAVAAGDVRLPPAGEGAPNTGEASSEGSRECSCSTPSAGCTPICGSR